MRERRRRIERSKRRTEMIDKLLNNKNIVNSSNNMDLKMSQIELNLFFSMFTDYIAEK